MCAQFAGQSSLRAVVTALFLTLLTLVSATLAGCAASVHGVARPTPHASPSTTIAPPAALPAAESGLLPWSLPNPISREVVLAGPAASQVSILGGLTATGGSASGIYTLSTTNGALAQAGTLLGPVHDASGAILAGREIVFGGGTVASSAVVQAVPTTLGTATSTGKLPQARSDSAATVIGGVAFVVGGYDGSTFDSEVLATTNGSSFQPVASLPVPVRYPAVASLGGLIYVFGGQTANGLVSAQIQVVNPATHAARVLGTMPEPNTGAVAMNIGGTIYVAGGNTSAASGTAPIATIWAFMPATSQLLAAGSLRVPVAHAGAAVLSDRAWIIGGETAQGAVSSVQMLTPNAKFGAAGQPGAGSPFFGGDLLVADAGSNRLLLLNPSGQVIWTYPSATAPAPPGGFYYPDDAFFADHGTAIVMNMESFQEIVKVAYPSGKVLWTYGHPGVAGSAPGYLNTPDDAYQLKTGQISVADIVNCRVLIINPNGTLAQQIGTTGSCTHRPPTHLGSPNGDTPLTDGTILVSEINGSWVSDYTTTGGLVWTTHLAISYPSDPQQLGPNQYLIASYTSPGQIVEFNQQGTITYRYDVTSGPGALNHPSLVEMLPSGVFMLNDDQNNRMIAIDPATGATVWQYGVTGVAGTAPGLLDDPDGFDLLMANGTTPTHPGTG
ncbi:MAG: outer membrane protein assembly factor BamB family protein [Candidatus Dormibacteria bacterium]